MLLNLNDFRNAIPSIINIVDRNKTTPYSELATIISASTHIPLLVVYAVISAKYNIDFTESIAITKDFYKIEIIVAFDPPI